MSPPLIRRSILATGAMLSAAALSYALTPTTRRHDMLGALELDKVIPTKFGDWQIDTSIASYIIDPQTKETIEKIYTSTLSRNYIDRHGQRVMLAIAYGAELTDTGVGLHYPEICYPAQGFKLSSSERTILNTSLGNIRATQLVTAFGDTRPEPVTYWVMIGAESQHPGMSRKLAELRYGLKGVRVDGLLFRVSSIDRVTGHAWRVHKEFVEDLLTSLAPAARQRLSGLS